MLDNLRYIENSSISDHLNEFQGLLDQLSRMVINFDDEVLVLLLLNTLPESWEIFWVSITNFALNGIVSLQMAKSTSLNEEMRRKTHGSSSQSDMLVTEIRGRSQKKEPKGGREKSRSKSKSRYKNIECHYCNKIGHIQKYCFKWKKENADKKGKQKENDLGDDRVTTTTTGGDLVLLHDFESVNLVSNESMWFIDSGAKLHITPRNGFFTSYISCNFGVLNMGNDGVLKVVSDVCLQSNMGG